MKAALLKILRCPACHSFLKLIGCSYSNQDNIETGTLQCTGCNSTYLIHDGVPCMLLQHGLVNRTRKGFEYQWTIRQNGKAEDASVVYGYDIQNFMAWFIDEFAPSLRNGSLNSSWLLDAGCGSAEKARILALHFPQHQIVAIDQSISIIATAKKNADLPNLHFVQANVLYPPFLENIFQFAMSIGVLHHTPDTLSAFKAIAALVAPGGDLATWIYPLPSENTFWAGLYRQRDRHFMHFGHRLPKRITMAWCYAYVAIFFPLIVRFLKAQYRVNTKIFPSKIYPQHPSRMQLFRSAVFLSFDNVMPTHQFRHGHSEVTRWYLESGFESVNAKHPGFFHATRTAPHIDKSHSGVSETMCIQTLISEEVCP